MAETKNTKINLPSGMGDEITIRLNGSDPKTYKVSDSGGTPSISVPNEDAEAVARAIRGASIA